jgi:hypothetical protein
MNRLPLFAWLTFATLVLVSCSDDVTPTQPETSERQQLSPTALALASNTWTPRAPLLQLGDGFALGEAPNAAGQSIAYVFGGLDEDGDPVFPIQAYNVTTDTWVGKSGFLRAANTNGVGKIGNRIYLTGGEIQGVNFTVFNRTWAYEPSTDRLFQKADMPKATFSGVTGVIDRKLYVLPGFCTGELDIPAHCDPGGPIRQLYRYDPATNTWVTRRQAPHYHTGGASGVIDGKFYVAGGTTPSGFLTDLDVYDPTTNTWKTLAPLPSAGEERWGAVLQDKLFVVARSRPGGGQVTIKAYSYAVAAGGPPGVPPWDRRIPRLAYGPTIVL